MKSAKTKQLWKNVILYVVKILVALIMFLPIIWIITGGFKTLTEFTTSSNIIPKKVTFENFIYIFKNSNIWLYTRNTVLLMGGTTAGTLISSSLVAYPLARMEFRGKNLIFSIIIATMMIPNIALIIPQYIMFGKLGWLDSLFPMIIPALLIRIMYSYSDSISVLFQRNWMSLQPLTDATKCRFSSRYWRHFPSRHMQQSQYFPAYSGGTN